MSSSADVSPSVTPSGTPLSGTHAPKFGTVIPNRIFVGGIAANTTEVELKQFFSAYGAVKDSKIIADRAGVSKGYGFITFENQEDAERIIKKESDNLVFKDRKLNIGPAVRKQQVLPRSFGVEQISSDLIGTVQKDASVPAGTVLFTNGVPYTYQNGMAVFHAPEGYPIAQPQVNSPSYSTVMVPQTPTMYVSPQYSAYQPSTPQWTTAASQWRWAPQQSPQQAVTGSPGYIYAAINASPELMYAQPPPHAYQPSDITDAAVVDSQTMEGSLFHKPVEQSLTSHTYATDVTKASDLPTKPLTTPSISTCTTPTVAVTMPILPSAVSHSVVTQPLCKPSISSSAAPYPKKTTIATIPRRPFSSPTILIKHGHKVQRVMMPPKAITPGGHMTILRSPDGCSGDGADMISCHSVLSPPPNPDLH